MDAALRKFTIAHENDDTVSLLLKGGEYQGIDLKTAVVQIEARRKVKSKIPLFYSCPDIFYPSLISVEQCSSESTAKFKCRFLPDADATLCDLTGGLGVDSFFFSRQTGRVFYCEKNPAICDAVEENFKVLGANNITAFNVDCENLEALSAAMQCAGRHADILFIDPSRRDSNSNRKYALEDCSPNVPSLLGSLFAICPRVLVKASPMLDISFISRLFPSWQDLSEEALPALRLRNQSLKSRLQAAVSPHSFCSLLWMIYFVSSVLGKLTRYTFSTALVMAV
jgi:Predicted RNA methylase